MSADHVTVDVADGIATLTLNRPDKRNAMTLDMWQAVATHATTLAGDPDVRVLVVTGSGGHFSAGADIAGFGHTDHGAVRAANAVADDALAAFPKPSVAVIRGACVGGAAGIAAACDLRLADATARFGITPARLGLVYPTPDVERIVRLIGPAATKHLLFSAELIEAERALRIGFVDELHAPEALADRVAELTAVLTQRSLLTQMASKELVDAVAEHGTVPGEVSERWAVRVAASDDPAEGVRAFLGRRDPEFAWRP